MIKKFCVKNFKNFKNEITLDFSKIRDYGFNQELIRDGLINKMLIYGPNNSGKSNLGAAIMDITFHLGNNYDSDDRTYLYYLNGDCTFDYASFKYEFLFGEKLITYVYEKNTKMELISEELWEGDNLLFEYNYRNNKYTNNIKEAQTIDISKRSSHSSSALKFIYTNTLYWPEDSAVKLLMEFVSGMICVRSFRNDDVPFSRMNGNDLHEFIIDNGLLGDFEKFLQNCGQCYNLTEINEGGRKFIGVKFRNYKARFELVASTGTQSLWLFYYFLNKKRSLSFVYLDEFDAFYHYELATSVLRYINEKKNIQTVLTSHNTYLISNELMRPDCYFMLNNGKVNSFADRTMKTIRQAHNLEKMMLGGEFEE